MKSREEIETQLNQLKRAISSMVIYNHSLRPDFRYTSNVLNLAKDAEAFWLIDAIASYQSSISRLEISSEAKRELSKFQIWLLSVNLETKEACLTCKQDTNTPPVIVQTIEYTSFPLPEIELWVEWNVLLLPAER